MSKPHTENYKPIEDNPSLKFETTDFYLACFLRCLGYNLADLRRDGRRSIFVFHEKPERRATMMAFYDNEVTVHPLAFVGAIKDMKAWLPGSLRLSGWWWKTLVGSLEVHVVVELPRQV